MKSSNQDRQSDYLIGEKMTITKHCWLPVYAFLTCVCIYICIYIYIYILYYRYWALFIYKYNKLSFIYIYNQDLLKTQDKFCRKLRKFSKTIIKVYTAGSLK